MPRIDQPLLELLPILHSRACLRCREREPGRLQLRVVLNLEEDIHDVIVQESDTHVEVLILLTGDARDGEEAVDCPVHVDLSAPLGDREVVDRSRGGAVVARFTPDW